MVSPRKYMERGRTSSTMSLAKKGVCVLHEYIQKKNAYALFGQASRRAVQINTTKKYHFASVPRAILRKSKNQKCRIGRGEKEAF